jgi:hypothetical protein
MVLLCVLLLSGYSRFMGVALAVVTSTTVTFSPNASTSWDGGIAETGDGSTTTIPGLTLQFYNISDINGTRIVSKLERPTDGFDALTSYALASGSKGMAIKSVDGAEFQINGFFYSNWGHTDTENLVQISVVGYRNNAQVATASFLADDSVNGYYSKTVSLNASFDNVDTVFLYSSGISWHGINSIEIDSPISIANFANTGKTGTTASFSWTAASGATGIILQQSPTGQNSWTTATTGSIATNATSATVTGLSAFTSYDFRLVVTGGANAGNSNTASATTNAVPIANFANTGKTGTTASFSWTAASGATAIILQQSLSGQNSWTTATTGVIATSATSATVTGLSPVTGYDFRLVVTGGANAGTSNMASATTDSLPIANFASTGKTSTTASFSWTAASGATGIIIEQSPTGQNSWTTATTGTIATSATSATVTSLSLATSYDFRLVVTGGAKAGTSNMASATTDAVPIADLASTGKTSTTASFSWTAASGATGIVLQQSPSGQNSWTTATTGTIATNATSATVTGLSLATSYDFRLTVTGGANAGTSNTASATTDAVPIANFANTGKTGTTASFSWTAASGATGIVLQQSPTGQNSWTTATTGVIATNATSATVTGLSPVTGYDFRLVVTGGANAGTSNMASATTDSLPIANFASTGKTSTTASFSWTASSGATGIIIEQSPTGQNSWTTAATGTITTSATSATVTSLGLATSYDFRLVVTGGANAGTSNTVSATTDAVPIADLTSMGKTSTTASFSWTAASGATGIVLQQSPSGQNSWTTATTGTIATNATSATVTGLSLATSYDFRLTVTGGANAGTSNTASATTDAVPLADLASTGKTGTTASFSWTAASGATGIVLQQSPTGQNSWTTAITSAIATNATSATVTGLSPATSYDFRLVVTGGANAGNSNTVTTTTDAVPIANFANTGKTSTTALFSWTAASGATGIVIEQSPSGQNTWTTAATGTIATGATSATVTGLSPITSYDFRMVVTGGANAGISNTASATMDAVPIADFASTGKSITTATFSWTAASGATVIVLQQSPVGQNSWSTATTGTITTSATSATVTGLSPATSYDFRLMVTSGANAGTSNTASVITDPPLTYMVAAITDQTATALILGYASGTQEPKTITVSNIGTGNLTNLNAMLGGLNANNFAITQPASSVVSGAPSTSFTVKAKDGLAAGTYTATVTVSADNMTSVTFDITQVVNLPDAPANPQNLIAIGGDRQVTLNWNTVTGATYYSLYMSPVSGQYSPASVTTVTYTTYNVQNLMNGTTYYFVVKAGNPGGLSAESNQAHATPATVASAPTNVIAVAGDGQATITFAAPTDNGGSAITSYQATASPGNVVMTGTSSPITIPGLTNGISYTFTVKAINSVGSSIASSVSNAVIPSSPPDDSGKPETTKTGVDILVNGKVENAGTATTTIVNGQTVITIVIDQKKLEEKLTTEGQGAVVTIPVNIESDVVVGELNGQMIKNMENKQAILEIKTVSAAYTLPAQQFNIDSLSNQMGLSIALQDIKVQIEIAVPTEDTVKVVEDAANRGMFTLVVSPVNFIVRGTYGGTTVEITKFNAYVKRTIAIPDGVDPSKITTGIVVEPDGTIRHVPTKIVKNDGKYHAIISSLTNSTYSVVWHQLEFSDVTQHWAKNAVNDMGSRMVVEGTGKGMFHPDQDITRAEFAAILIRGLGLKLEKGASTFSDVKAADWYNDAINTAYTYHLIDGFEDGTFRPNDKITREQATVILAKAMTITSLRVQLSAPSIDGTLRPYTDAAVVSTWARSSMADSIQAGIVSGRSTTELAPKDAMTRAEVAAIIQRLLQKSDVI